jgi:hypothetical protein
MRSVSTSFALDSRAYAIYASAFWQGCAAALELLAQHAGEYGEMLDSAADLYEETCAHLAHLQQETDDANQRTD